VRVSCFPRMFGRWFRFFGKLPYLRKRRPKPHMTWHLDEVYLKIDGRMVYLWRAVDAEGEVLDVLVQSRKAGGAEPHAQAVEEIWPRLLFLQ
jgi:transposase-like protein